MSGSSVVGETNVVPQVRYHAALLAGLESAERHFEGRAKLREVMDLSRTGLDNIMNGTSAPSEKRLWDLREHVPNVLDSLAELYGARIVPKGSLCDTDMKAAPALCAALHKIIQAEADGVVDHAELLGMERELVEAEQAIQQLRARIGEIRKPRSVA